MANRRTVSEHPTTDEEKIRLDIAVEVTVRAINNRNEIPIVIIRKLLSLHLNPTAKKGSTTQEELFDRVQLGLGWGTAGLAVGYRWGTTSRGFPRGGYGGGTVD